MLEFFDHCWESLLGGHALFAGHLPTIAGVLLGIFVFAMIHETFAEARTPAYILFFGVIVHILVLWDIAAADSRIVMILDHCIIPAAISLILLLFMGKTPLWGIILPFGAYALVHSLAAMYDNVFIPIMVGLAVLPIFLFIFRIAHNQFTMDSESRDMLGDSSIVQELYAQGYRPSGYYQGSRRRSRAQYQLRLHGVDTED